MENPAGQTPDHLIESFAKRPFSFDFYRAVRLLESHFRDSPRVGYSQRVEHDIVRFAQNPSLAFAPSNLESVETGGHNWRARLFVNFLGLMGPNGPLPQHITEYARDRLLNAKDPTLSRFFDVFNHRLLSLFYRAWASAQKSVDYDRPEEAKFADYVGSVFGLGMPGLHNRDAIPDRAKLYFSGRLACQTRNADGLEAIIRDFFGVEAEVQECVGYWMKLPAANQCRLGESPSTGSIGLTTVVGSRKYEAQLKFRIRLGPLKMKDFQKFLPGQPAFQRLKAWVLNYSGQQFFWDLQCVLLASEVPSVSLGQSGQLGWTTWIKSGPSKKDADDPIFDSELPE